MTMFGALPIAGSGMNADQVWIDAIGGNIANANDTAPGNVANYQAQYPVVTPAPASTASGIGNGATVTGVALGSAQGELAYDPGNPLADAQGYVSYPQVDMGAQLVDLVMAQTNYQANAAVATQAIQAYKSALTLAP